MPHSAKMAPIPVQAFTPKSPCRTCIALDLCLNRRYKAVAYGAMMAKFAELRKIALSLPLSYEALHFGGPSFRVNNRKYALHWLETGQTILKLPNELQDVLFKSRPDAVRPIKVGTAFWSVVVLPRLNRTDLESLVTAAWSTVVPKTVAREYLSAVEQGGSAADDWRFLFPVSGSNPSRTRKVRR